MPTVHIKLHLPEEVIAQYEADGPLEEVLSKHLKKTADYKGVKPLFINDALRQRVEKFFGRNFDSPVDLIKLIEKYATIRIEGMEMQIQPQLLSKLRTRHFNRNETFEQFLAKQIITGLEEFVGVR